MSTGFDYRPKPAEYLPGQKMPPVSDDKKVDQAYERWRVEMVYAVHGPQNKKTWGTGQYVDGRHIPEIRTAMYTPKRGQ